MKRVATALVLVPLVLAAVFWLPIWIFSIVLGMVALITTHEYLNLCQATGLEPFRNLTLLATALLFAAWPITLNRSTSVNLYPEMSLVVPLSPMLGLAATLLLALTALCLGMRRPGENEALRGVLGGAAASVFAIPYIALTLGALVLLRDLHWGPWWLLYLFVVVWSGDIFAYYTGRALGRHAMAPRISPKKTWEGAAASFVGAIALGALMFAFQPEITTGLANIHALTRGSLAGPPVWHGAVLSAILNVVAQLGDLAESMLKRGAGVKDSGALLPGHGGMLDRIDALLFAAPVLWYYAFFATI